MKVVEFEGEKWNVEGYDLQNWDRETEVGDVGIVCLRRYMCL